MSGTSRRTNVSMPNPSSSPRPVARSENTVSGANPSNSLLMSRRSTPKSAGKSSRSLRPDALTRAPEKNNGNEDAQGPSEFSRSEITRLSTLLQETEVDLDESRRETQTLRRELNEARAHITQLEDEITAHLEELDRIRNLLQESEKSKMQLQKLAETEQNRLLLENEGIKRSNSELSAHLKALRNEFQVERRRSASPSDSREEITKTSDSTSLDTESQLKAKERHIRALKLTLDDMKNQLDQQTILAVARSQELEEALSQAKLENARLSENVESYQVLLQERTLRGDYQVIDFSEEHHSERISSSGSLQPGEEETSFTSLASEIQETETADTQKLAALQSEVRHLRDSNRAMTLYINEIIGRLLQTKGFEHVLEKDAARPMPLTPGQSHFAAHRRPHEARISVEMPPRKSVASESSGYKRMSTEIGSPSVSTGSGLSRAFSFRRKPDQPNTSTNLRPLKLVEEQHPKQREEAAIHGRARTHGDDIEAESGDNKLGKRASWVPGWFNKVTTGHME